MNLAFKVDASRWTDLKSPAYQKAVLTGVRKATDAGARLLLDKAKAAAPVGGPYEYPKRRKVVSDTWMTRVPGTLKRAHKRKRLAPNVVVVHVDPKIAFYARFVHDGHKTTTGSVRPNRWFQTAVRDNRLAVHRVMDGIYKQELQGVTTGTKIKELRGLLTAAQDEGE